jgi:hypothetical protein
MCLPLGMTKNLYNPLRYGICRFRVAANLYRIWRVYPGSAPRMRRSEDKLYIELAGMCQKGMSSSEISADCA